MNMLPKQVRDAQERSDQLAASLTPPAAETAAPPDPKHEAQPPDDKPDASPRKDYKAAYYVLQGKYNAEVPRLNEQLKAATARISELEAKITTAPDGEPPANSQTEDDDGNTAGITDRDREMFGDDLVDFVARAKAEAVKELQGKVQKIEATEAERAAEIVKQRREAFMAAFEAKVPNWQEIDQEPGWQAYLAERDRFSGRQRQELLQDAFASGDVDRTAAFFDAYSASKAPPAAHDPIAEQAVPPPSGRAPGGVEKKRWNRAEVAAFYRDLAAGRIPAARAKELEADIEAAAREGRIH